MKPIFLDKKFNSDNILNSDKFDRKRIKKLKGFEYRKFNGKNIPLSIKYDLRKFMVYGIGEIESVINIHVPQYQKVFSISQDTANVIFQKSTKYLDSFYEEI